MSTQRYASCIHACNACSTACEHCATTCLKAPNIRDLTICMILTRDCADMCRFAARLMARESPLVDEISRLCAIACQACAEECGKHPLDHCQACAQVCQRCVEECEELLSGGG